MKNYIFSALVIFLIAVGIMIFMTLPEYEGFVSLMRQMNASQSELDERESRLKEMFELNQRLQEHQIALDKISSALPLYPDFPSLMVYLTQKASESGLVLLRPENVATVYYSPLLAAEDERGAGEVKAIKFDVLLTGRYPSLKNFVRVIEGSSRLVGVSYIDAREDQDMDHHLYRVGIETFFYQE